MQLHDWRLRRACLQPTCLLLTNNMNLSPCSSSPCRLTFDLRIVLLVMVEHVDGRHQAAGAQEAAEAAGAQLQGQRGACWAAHATSHARAPAAGRGASRPRSHAALPRAMPAALTSAVVWCSCCSVSQGGASACLLRTAASSLCWFNTNRSCRHGWRWGWHRHVWRWRWQRQRQECRRQQRRQLQC